MNTLKKILLTSAFVALPLLAPGQQLPLNKEKKPTKIGITYYLNTKGDSTTFQFEDYFNTKFLEEPYFKADDLRLYVGYNPGELGYYFEGGEIIIDNQENFIGYSKETTHKRQLRNFSQVNAFVRGTLIHEIAHHYFYEINNFRKTSKSAIVLSVVPNEKKFFNKFIEEGFSEYCAIEMNEVKMPKEIFVPKTEEELKDSANFYDSRYMYAAHFVKPVLDRHGLEPGLNILMGNPIKSIEEILNPELYYNRLDTISPIKEMLEYKEIMKDEFDAYHGSSDF